MTRTFPAPEPGQVDMNLVHMCRNGFWTCSKCGHLTFRAEEPDAFDPGEVRAICGLCASPGIVWHAPVFVD